ncbi:MAG: DNA primase [Pseudomonadota bacterium]
MIPQDFIDDVLSRVDIVEIVQPRVSLKKQGNNYTGLCPFHNEKSPSFSVSQDKQFYYCFGCQASGNALKFLMEFDRMEFRTAIEFLASSAGMEIPQERTAEAPAQTQRRKSIFEVLSQATDFFKDQLRQNDTRERAITYLKGRGLSGEIARDYGIGYAPPGWDNLYRALAKSNLERELLIESGMVIDNPEEDKTYDRFRDRIMFPIRDLRGRTIAFGGRIIGDGKPKYLNSPETPVFHKGRELYGLYEARQRVRRLEEVMIVEGYMDVVALAQHGVNYCVATLGTATTADHLDRLFRMVSRLVFCFDGDSAGRNAAWKALLTALPFMRDGRSARFLFLPDGEDPDSLVRQEGKDKFEERLTQAPHLPEVFFDHLSADLDIESLDGKASLASLAMPLIQTMPEGVFRQLMIDRLSGLTGLSAERLQAAYRPRSAPPDEPAAGRGTQRPDQGVRRPHRSNEELVNMAISMLFRNPDLAAQFDESVYEKLAGDADTALLSRVIQAIDEDSRLSPALLLAGFQESEVFGRLRRLAGAEPLLGVENLPAEFAGIVNALLRRLESESIQELRNSLISKPLAELSEAERETLRKLTRNSASRH